MKYVPFGFACLLGNLSPTYRLFKKATPRQLELVRLGARDPRTRLLLHGLQLRNWKGNKLALYLFPTHGTFGLSID